MQAVISINLDRPYLTIKLVPNGNIVSLGQSNASKWLYLNLQGQQQ